MTSIEIRPTIPTDLAALADVLVEVHTTDGYPVEGVDDARGWLELDAPMGQWTALLLGEPVGHVAMVRPSSGDAAPGMLAERADTPIAEIAVLARLFLAPTARGQSLADRLIGAVEERARSLTLKLTLDVMEKDQAAISLYERRGWVTLGRFDHVHSNGERTPAVAMMAPVISTHAGVQ